MIHLYRFLYLLLKTLVITFKPLLSQKSQKWIQLRSEIFIAKWKSLQLSQCIWIHASSGEIEYAKPLIREIKIKQPSIKIVVTYSSESAEKLFTSIQNSVEYFIPLCWDDVYSTRFLIQKLNPQIIVFSRTDLWPELIYQAHQLKIPMGVISYFPKLTFFSKIYLKKILSKLSFISCVDQTTELHIKNLKLNSSVLIAQHGDARFDQVFARLEQSTLMKIKNNCFTLCMGSTWPEDEAFLFPLFNSLLASQNNLILCPHDVSPNNIVRLSDELKKLNIPFVLFSELKIENEINFSFILIDQVGVLADLYRFSSLAFIGGSFKNRVHSVMEPLCCGLPVLTGPFVHNNPEALKYSKFDEMKCVYICQNSNEIENTIIHLKKQNLSSIKSHILTEMNKNKGATENILKFILDNVLKKSNF